MTSTSNQQQIPSQITGAASQSIAPSGTSSQQAAAGRGFTNAAKRQGSISLHAKSDSISASSGKGPILPAVPSFGGPTIVNGNNAVGPSAYQPDHSRKPSVTISASGASGQMPNGGPMAGKSAMASGMNVQFGSMNANASPNISHSSPHLGQSSGSLAVSPSNPRVTSPQQSPSPIPQPATASGGRPPSSLQGQGNGVSFGNFGSDEPNVRAACACQ
jgi:translation initiation factor 4G